MSRLGMKMMLICDGQLVNGHSKSEGMSRGSWTNPLDVIPPVGSIVEYKTFNQGTFEGKGVLTQYEVKGYCFTTEEDYNGTYSDKVCKIFVSLVQ